MTKKRIPSYLKPGGAEKLADSVEKATARLRRCDLCPRECKVNRTAGEVGFCKSGAKPKVSSYNLHHGEEPVISGRFGSGTIFFTRCTLGCIFCQNYPISHLGRGNEIEIETLAAMMLKLQSRGAHNVNLVTPTHFVPQFLAALQIAVSDGLHIPVVYNTSGYERVDTLEALDGIVDIYLPDMKYADEKAAMRLSSAPRYPEINRSAVKEMFRQVGIVETDDDNVAWKGVVIRHLVLPDNLAGTEKIMKFIAEEISPDVYISLMSQYFPAHLAHDRPPMDQRITKKEYRDAVRSMEKYGLRNGWTQPV